MPNLQQADEYFASHLLKERIFEFSDEQRRAAVTAATLDITAELKLETFPANPVALILSAVFEQAIYLLFNPHIVSGSIDAAGKDIISPRAKAMLFERDTILSGTAAGDDPFAGGGNTGTGSNTGTGGSTGTGSSTGTGNIYNTGSGIVQGPVIEPSIQLSFYRG